MTEVEVRIGGRAYRLACAPGEEPHLAALARVVDAEARAIGARVGPVGEHRLLAMTALMLADRLHEAQTALARTGAARPGTEPELEEALDRLERLVEDAERE